MASYVFARVCDERHVTRVQALEDMVGLIHDEFYYTRNDRPPRIMRRTPMIGIGSHGGRGLFILGHCNGVEWEPLQEPYAPYRHRIDVLWEGAVYGAEEADVLHDVTKYNRRSWTSATRHDFQLVQSRILEGEVVRRIREDPVLPWTEQ